MLGNAGKKLQKMVDLAEELYQRMNELREQLRELQDTVEETNDRVSGIEAAQADNRAILNAIAENHDIDVEAVLDSIDED